MKASSAMAKLARRYLAHRRSFGYRLRAEGYYLTNFARFMDRNAPGQPLTIKLALQWVRRRSVLPVTRAIRLSMIRNFASFCATLDKRTEVPPGHLIQRRSSRQAQHIFTDAQVRLILRRAARLRSSAANLRPMTFQTLIALLACTGIRPSEALRLRDEDFNARAGTLSVPSVKRSPGRTIPLHSSTVRALKYYQRIRRSWFSCTKHFFVGAFGEPLQIWTADSTFAALVHDIPGNGSHPHPRLYDFRHTFTTKLISRWSRQSVPLAHHLVLLSRYLGHKDFHQTYWYVGPDLPALQSASARLERYRYETTTENEDRS